ncbi:MAG: hypothetical protein M4579_005820 [Chaenotheca gracillima]|nr:MAG: hypothetical protein M4579_005820 [Chaenotheca gracillima]
MSGILTDLQRRAHSLVTPEMTSNPSLYGAPRPNASKKKEISSSTALSFSSQLSSLLSAGKDAPRASTGRSRPSQSRSDIFTAHNKNTKKRALRDLEDDGHSRPRDTGGQGVDDSVLHRSKRRMEEKARLYAAMKRGDYVAPGGDDKRNLEELGLVDFDRKWAENEAKGQGNELDTSSDDEDEDDGELEKVEYTDEFGRQRMGTRAEVAQEERRRRVLAADEPDRFSARPSQPSNLIYGDTVQAAAFNPDEPVAVQIEELAKKRDRSLTPPPETHYDAKAEVRSKGVGFYAFSGDKEGRKREMEDLAQERAETERSRKEKAERLDKRRQEIEERRRMIREKRGEKQADRFLEGLGGTLGNSSKPEEAQADEMLPS